jgi:hypothetical protein
MSHVIRIDNLRMDASNAFPGSMIYWDEKNWQSWLMIGYDGLSFHHFEDKGNFVPDRHPTHLYSIIGVDQI